MPNKVYIFSLGQWVESDPHPTVDAFTSTLTRNGALLPRVRVITALAWDHVKGMIGCLGCCTSIIREYKLGHVTTEQFRSGIRDMLGLANISDTDFDIAWNVMSAMNSKTIADVKALIAVQSSDSCIKLVIAGETNELHANAFFDQLGMTRQEVEAKGIVFSFSYEQHTLDRHELAARGLASLSCSKDDVVISLHRDINNYAQLHLPHPRTFLHQPYFPREHGGNSVAHFIQTRMQVDVTSALRTDHTAITIPSRHTALPLTGAVASQPFGPVPATVTKS